jgi:hypothetical protein
MKRPVVPSEIIEEIGLREPKTLKKTATLIQDTKHTNQYSIKISTDLIESVNWIAGDKIEIKIENDELILRKSQA